MGDKDIGLTVSKEKEFEEWYPQLVLKSGLADYSKVKGCMIIKPHGYAIWENITAYFNKRLKERKVQNAYFPLFIPESFFKKEAEHAEGFSPEVAWIANTEEGERLAIRPTSETIMYDAYSKWIRSHRDLPLRINQWGNVVRWETKATRLFLRTREFLWQEGHCVYETKEENEKETLIYLEEYKKLLEGQLAIPVLAGRKTDKEKFAGADYTLSIEALMPDGKMLQMGTSHNLGQNFAKSFDISFLGKDEKRYYPWQNSWGLSTRTIGALVMAHGDDKGLVLPPNIAPVQIMIIPIYDDKTKQMVLDEAKEIQISLKQYRVELDANENYTPGWKFHEYELKGVPLRIEIGPKDIEKKSAVLARRDTKKKESVKLKDVAAKAKSILEEIQDNLFKIQKKFLESSIVKAKSMNDLVNAIKDGKIALSPFCNTAECEECIREKTGGAKSINIPFEQQMKIGEKCPQCNKEAKVMCYFGKSY